MSSCHRTGGSGAGGAARSGADGLQDDFSGPAAPATLEPAVRRATNASTVNGGSPLVGLYQDGAEIWALIDNVAEEIVQPSWNRLRAECVGSHLFLDVNVTLVIETDDGTHKQGDIRLGAGGGRSGFPDVRFDNLAISRP